MALPDTFSGISRVNWWRYKYMFIALLVINAFAFHFFFLDGSQTSLNPFRANPPPPFDTETQPFPDEPPLVDTPGIEHAIATPVEEQKPEVADPPIGAEPDPVKQEDPEPENVTESNSAAPSKAIVAPLPTHLDIPKYPAVKFVSPPPTNGSIGLSNYDFRGEYIGWPLGRVCSETTYTEGLYVECDNNSGGIGNIRNFILTCVRYAIEAGATGIVMPRIQKRAEDHLQELFTSTFQPFDYFFDEKHFRFAMNRYCPKISIYGKLDEVPNFNMIASAKEFFPKDLIKGGRSGDGCDERGINRHIDMFRVKFDEWLNKIMRRPTLAAPVSVRFQWPTFFEWPVYRDGPEFVTTFGDLLRIRPDIEELAARTIDGLVRIIHNTTEKPNRNTLDAPFLGIHLRTEADALGFWPNFETQAKGYIEQAGKRGLKYAYIASGDAKEGHRFGELAVKHVGMKVYGKTDLLHDENLENLNRLSWDQQALVDFLVLTKSAHFTGCSFSSFTMNIAIRRHTMLDGIKTRQWKSPGDVYSTLVGRFEEWYGDWMFMYECMWP